MTSQVGEGMVGTHVKVRRTFPVDQKCESMDKNRIQRVSVG